MRLTSAVLGAMLATMLGAPWALADDPGTGPPTVRDGVATQAWQDRSAADPDKMSPSGGWADMTGGLTDRPYVTELSVINGSEVTPVITGGTTAAADIAPGGVGAVVSPINLCRPDQTPGPGSCYATPNRVALDVVYGNGEYDGSNFAAPGQAVTPTVDSGSVIDMTVALNSLGTSLRWSYVNGDLLYWRTTDLGQPDSTVRIKFRPAPKPYITQYPDGSGCSATPIFNCSITQADAETLQASVLFSLDDTLDPALTGAVFATRNAVAGYLSPGRTADGAPQLELQAASSHLRADGSPQLGTLQAFLPAAALQNLYGLLPADAAAAFAVTRAGDPGSNDPPAFQTWTADDNGADGLLVTVSGITFSVPKYRMKGKLPRTTARAAVIKGRAVVGAEIRACDSTACRASLYDLGSASAPRYRAHRKAVLVAKPVHARLTLRVPVAKLPARHRFLLVVRSARTRHAVASTLGVVR